MRLQEIPGYQDRTRRLPVKGVWSSPHPPQATGSQSLWRTQWASGEHTSELSQPSGEDAGILIHRISNWYQLRVASAAVTRMHVWLLLLGQVRCHRQTEALSKQPSTWWIECRDDIVSWQHWLQGCQMRHYVIQAKHLARNTALNRYSVNFNHLYSLAYYMPGLRCPGMSRKGQGMRFKY